MLFEEELAVSHSCGGISLGSGESPSSAEEFVWRLSSDGSSLSPSELESTRGGDEAVMSSSRRADFVGGWSWSSLHSSGLESLSE